MRIMADTIVLCESPLQYKNALAYLAEYHAEQPALFIIRKNGLEDNDRHFVSLQEAGHHSFYGKRVKKHSRVGLFFFVLLIWCQFFFLRNNKRFVVGDVRSNWMKIVVSFRKTADVVFIDDGMATIATVPQMEAINVSGSKTLYTIFDIKSKTLKVIHRGAGSKCCKPSGRQIWFAGGPYVEKGILASESYQSILHYFIKQYRQSGELVYARHRSEDCLSQEDLLQLGFDAISEPEYTLEDKIDRMDELITVLVGLYSTALFNVKSVYPQIKVISYRCPDEYYLSNKKAIAEVYSFLDVHSDVDIEYFPREFSNG